MVIKLKDSRELILNHVFERFRFEVERKQDLDAKANNLAGFIGIILSLISGFGLTTLAPFTVPPLELTFNCARIISSIALLVVVVISLVVSIFFILKGMSIKEYICVPQAYNLIGAYENNPKYGEVSQALYDEYALAIEKNKNKNDEEAMDIKRSIYCLFIALAIFALAVILML